MAQNQKYALVVGCNYQYTTRELKGCINDANSMQDVLLKRFGLKRNNLRLLTDKSDSKIKPTAAIIKSALNHVLTVAKYGDMVFLFFSGHGTIVPASNSSSRKDEQAIVASDFNLITSWDFRRILNGAPKGVDFIIMSDSCHSGGLIDKEKEQIGPHHPVQNRPILEDITDHQPKMIPYEEVLHQLSLQTPINTPDIPAYFVQLFGEEASLVFQNIPRSLMERPLKPDQGILLSGCQPDEFCRERRLDGKWHGVFPWAVLEVLKKHPKPITNRDLVIQARKIVGKLEKQHPCLYCSDKNVHAFFLSQH